MRSHVSRSMRASGPRLLRHVHGRGEPDLGGNKGPETEAGQGVVHVGQDLAIWREQDERDWYHALVVAVLLKLGRDYLSIEHAVNRGHRSGKDHVCQPDLATATGSTRSRSVEYRCRSGGGCHGGHVRRGIRPRPTTAIRLRAIRRLRPAISAAGGPVRPWWPVWSTATAATEIQSRRLCQC